MSKHDDEVSPKQSQRNDPISCLQYTDMFLKSFIILAKPMSDYSNRNDTFLLGKITVMFSAVNLLLYLRQTYGSVNLFETI